MKKCDQKKEFEDAQKVVCITNLLRTPYVATASCSVKLQMLFSASSQSFPPEISGCRNLLRTICPSSL
jgi:hypothetical protein